jgi:phosphoglycerate kinase
MKKFFTLKDMNFKNQRVLLRAGFDVPLDEKGNITDDTRIKSILPTIKYLIKKKAMIIIISHNGRPKGEIVEKLKMNKIAARLQKLLGRKVYKLDDCLGEDVEKFIDDMVPGEVVVLENLRFYTEEKDKDKSVREGFARELADLADIYVNEAFSNSHREHASMTGIPKFIPSCAGFELQKEVETIEKAMLKPKKPFTAIIGGLKADKLNTIKALTKKVDNILVGGSLAFLLLNAKGIDVGKTKIDKEGLSMSKGFLKNKKIILPVDAVAADKFDKNAKSKIVKASEIPKKMMALDIGPETVKHYKEILKKAKTIIWAGPVGVFEFKKFENGTKSIASFISKLKAVTIIGGGDSSAAIEKFKLSKKMSHVSTGGGASLMLFEGEKLPSVNALEANYIKFK